YDVISHYDSVQRANALTLRDRRGREWRLGFVSSTFVQIFWLDKPRLDAETRHALARAFNDATAYGERIQQVSRKKPHSRQTMRSTARQTRGGKGEEGSGKREQQRQTCHRRQVVSAARTPAMRRRDRFTRPSTRRPS